MGTQTLFQAGIFWHIYSFDIVCRSSYMIVIMIILIFTCFYNTDCNNFILKRDWKRDSALTA